MVMVEKLKSFWHDQIPQWIPLGIAILGGVFWVGQQQQSIIDRLGDVESQVKAIQDYLRHDHDKSYSNQLPPGVSLNQESPQDAATQTTP